MNYVKNDDGEVKCLDEKGNVKWLPVHLVENRFLMKNVGLEAVQAPVFLPPSDKQGLTYESRTLEGSGLEDKGIITTLAESAPDFDIETIEEEKPKKVKPKTK